ncbi:hypothetical protein KUL118_58420 [Tenacibaculum sp. KUL118]|nr:hypothetical protein BACY1_25890 [Tenacibaculum mesophilum]GFD76729.1 hypothetical protein KUL113_61490 [Tenacibaculum sp. KUL113]GFD82980.1 hypothetical protein KUL118_58420 [Tenacibaculum sp. KUL118]
MDRNRRARIYLLIAFSIFVVNTFNVDFSNLNWEANKSSYVNMIAAVLVCIAIFLLIKKR